MQIITNWQARPLQCLADMPEKAQMDFGYLSEDDTHDTQRIEPDNGRARPMGWAMRVHPGSPLAHFDGIESDSYFSGLLYQFAGDDSVIVARYFS